MEFSAKIQSADVSPSAALCYSGVLGLGVNAQLKGKMCPSKNLTLTQLVNVPLHEKILVLLQSRVLKVEIINRFNRFMLSVIKDDCYQCVSMAM
jgi:hypothetical protein